MSNEPFEIDTEAIQALYQGVSEDAQAVVHAVLEIEASSPANIVKKIADRIRTIINEEG